VVRRLSRTPQTISIKDEEGEQAARCETPCGASTVAAVEAASAVPGYPGLMRLAVGDAVVYTRHGVGRVAGREQKLVLGLQRECVLLDLADGLRVTLPIEQARERLRAVVSEADLREVEQTLREDAGPPEGVWTKRMREGQAKLASGGALDLAEMVRDGIERDRSGVGGSPPLSIAERQLYVQARQLLAQEISVARKVEPAEADAWLEAQVALP
jgi:CarD family transcriptional regulator